jgi:hypothetical protein
MMPSLNAGRDERAPVDPIPEICRANQRDDISLGLPLADPSHPTAAQRSNDMLPELSSSGGISVTITSGAAINSTIALVAV